MYKIIFHIHTIYSDNAYWQAFWCIPPLKSQQLYVILFTKCHPSLFGIPPQAEEMDKVGFYSMLNFLLAQKPMAELWLPKVSGFKKTENISGEHLWWMDLNGV